MPKITKCPPLLRTAYTIDNYNYLNITPVRIVSETDKTVMVASKWLGQWSVSRRMKDTLPLWPTFEAAKAVVVHRAEERLENAKALVPKREAELATAKAKTKPDDEE